MDGQSLTALSKALNKRLLDRFPEWQPYVEAVESENGLGKKSLYLRVPGPHDPSRFISIRERGDCIEICFSDGRPPGGAEFLLVCEGGDEEECVGAAVEFVEELTEEKIVIARELSSWFFGRKVLPPKFIAAKEGRAREGLISVVSWRGTHDAEMSR